MRDTAPRRHPHKALTARSVASITEPGRYGDGGGLYLRVAPGGSKTWVLRTLIKGRRCDIGLGSTSLVSLAEARDRAYGLRKQARDGGDPLADKRAARKPVPTFEEAAVEVHRAHSENFKNAKHSKQWLASLGGVFSAFGDKRVDDVTTADVLSALSADWLTKPETSRRVLQRIRVVFDWCKAQGHRAADNPTSGVTKVLPKHRGVQEHHAALPYRELPKFIRTLRRSNSGLAAKLAFEFTILCAARPSETLLATWSEIDLKAKTWNVPAGRMKAGVEHRVPLSPRCVEILKQAKTIAAESPYVFPGRAVAGQPARPLSNMVFLMALRRLEREDLTAHGFRSTFRDWAEEQDAAPRSVAEAALAHRVRDKVEAAYRRTDLFDRRRELMNRWSEFATQTR